MSVSLIRVCFTLFFPLMVLFCRVGEARASISYSESFLGTTTDNNYFDVWQGWSSRFAFNMTAPGDTATLFNNSGVQMQSVVPTQDETHFIPGAYSLNSANLDFTVSSSDMARETVLIRAGLFDGNSCLLERTYTLGTWRTELNGTRKYADLSLNLVALGLGRYVEDGKFVSLVLAPDTQSIAPNDFRIDTAAMTVEANPVPLPAAAWMLGTGLLGLVGFRRKLR